MEFIRLGVIDLQSRVEMYRVGQSTIFNTEDFTLLGAASQGNMPEGAQITDAYFRQITSGVTGCNMLTEGMNYTVANVSFSGDGSGAVGTPVISNGKIIGIQMTAFGFGYTNCTAIITGDGTGATCQPLLNP